MGDTKRHLLWKFKPGDSTRIPAHLRKNWYAVAKRVEEETPYVFKFERVSETAIEIMCYDHFDSPDVDDWKPRARYLRHPLHFFEVGETRVEPKKNERPWRSTAYYIQSNSEKRFLFKPYDKNTNSHFIVERLPDESNPALYRTPTSIYGFHTIQPDETRHYSLGDNLEKVANALRQYEKRSAHGFNMEWKEDGLYVTRLW